MLDPTGITGENFWSQPSQTGIKTSSRSQYSCVLHGPRWPRATGANDSLAISDLQPLHDPGRLVRQVKQILVAHEAVLPVGQADRGAKCGVWRRFS
jgi:hypothetical protein